VHPFDRWLCRRALAFVAIAVGLSIGVIVATDEPFSTSQMRLARLSAMLPALGAVGAAAALAQARVRGELRALESLGARPFRSNLGATLAGWLAGAAAVALLATPLSDVSSLFPALSARAAWLPEAGALVDPPRGLRVWPHGEVELFAALAPPQDPLAPSRLAALLAVGPLALAVPVWVTAPIHPAARTLVAALSFVIVVVLLHAVAAERARPGWLVLASLPIAAQAAAGHLGLRFRIRRQST
jgi:hypothetical protein